MTRAIALGGVVVEPMNLKATGRRSYRSDDGSDLPARVLFAREEYMRVNPRSKLTVVFLGRSEWEELRTILKSELPLCGREPIKICGLAAIHDNGTASRLDVGYGAWPASTLDGE